MRFISPHSRYSIQVIEGSDQIVTDNKGVAQMITRAKPVIANFEQQGLHPWEIDAALERFNFAGVPEGVNPLTRVSVFDTEAYVYGQEFEDEDQAQAYLDRIDKRLLKLAERHPSEFIPVPKPLSGKPWPTYDEDSVEDILQLQERTGISAETIRLYEVENQKRAEVIEAMENLENAQAEVITVSV